MIASLSRPLQHPMPNQELRQQEEEHRARNHEIVHVEHAGAASAGEDDEYREDFQHVAPDGLQRIEARAADGEDLEEEVERNGIGAIGPEPARKTPGADEGQ